MPANLLVENAAGKRAFLDEELSDSSAAAGLCGADRLFDLFLPDDAVQDQLLSDPHAFPRRRGGFQLAADKKEMDGFVGLRQDERTLRAGADDAMKHDRHRDLPKLSPKSVRQFQGFLRVLEPKVNRISTADDFARVSMVFTGRA